MLAVLTLQLFNPATLRDAIHIYLLEEVTLPFMEKEEIHDISENNTTIIIQKNG